MAAGANTFINDMMQRAGLKNVFEQVSRYPSFELNELKELNPEYILLSSEPYRFKDSEVAALQIDFPEAKVLKVDGELFSWYGSRIKEAPAYFSSLFGQQGIKLI